MNFSHANGIGLGGLDRSVAMAMLPYMGMSTTVFPELAALLTLLDG